MCIPITTFVLTFSKLFYTQNQSDLWYKYNHYEKGENLKTKFIYVGILLCQCEFVKMTKRENQETYSSID